MCMLYCSLSLLKLVSGPFTNGEVGMIGSSRDEPLDVSFNEDCHAANANQSMVSTVLFYYRLWIRWTLIITSGVAVSMECNLWPVQVSSSCPDRNRTFSILLNFPTPSGSKSGFPFLLPFIDHRPREDDGNGQ